MCRDARRVEPARRTLAARRSLAARGHLSRQLQRRPSTCVPRRGGRTAGPRSGLFLARIYAIERRAAAQGPVGPALIARSQLLTRPFVEQFKAWLVAHQGLLPSDLLGKVARYAPTRCSPASSRAADAWPCCSAWSRPPNAPASTCGPASPGCSSDAGREDAPSASPLRSSLVPRTSRCSGRNQAALRRERVDKTCAQTAPRSPGRASGGG